MGGGRVGTQSGTQKCLVPVPPASYLWCLDPTFAKQVIGLGGSAEGIRDVVRTGPSQSKASMIQDDFKSIQAKR